MILNERFSFLDLRMSKAHLFFSSSDCIFPPQPWMPPQHQGWAQSTWRSRLSDVSSAVMRSFSWLPSRTASPSCCALSPPQSSQISWREELPGIKIYMCTKKTNVFAIYLFILMDCIFLLFTCIFFYLMILDFLLLLLLSSLLIQSPQANAGTDVPAKYTVTYEYIILVDTLVFQMEFEKAV